MASIAFVSVGLVASALAGFPVDSSAPADEVLVLRMGALGGGISSLSSLAASGQTIEDEKEVHLLAVPAYLLDLASTFVAGMASSRSS